MAPPSFTCPVCWMTSYNRNDIDNQYCPWCHTFPETRAVGIFTSQPAPGPRFIPYQRAGGQFAGEPWLPTMPGTQMEYRGALGARPLAPRWRRRGPGRWLWRAWAPVWGWMPIGLVNRLTRFYFHLMAGVGIVESALVWVSPANRIEQSVWALVVSSLALYVITLQRRP